ncbi:MAG: XRE family transcriptional regulator [Dehalococcoidales bacterium]|nr:XRE family transcriptional regulator [Dehalococcoidales bacterium]
MTIPVTTEIQNNSENRVQLNNPHILTWAREELNLTTDMVANHLKKPVSLIEAWEKGSEFPTFRQLSDLANYYKRPIAVFFFSSLPPKFLKPIDHRTLPGHLAGHYSRETLLAYRQVADMLHQAHDLFNELDVDISFSLPHWKMTDDPDKKALELRSILGISVEEQIKSFSKYNIALDRWRDVLFDHGIIVRVCEMPISDARAFCLLLGNLAGIGLSNEDKDHGRIFSLFHEVCHICLDIPGVSGITTSRRNKNTNLEQYCDRFAAAFLLPASSSEVCEKLDLFQDSTIDYFDIAQAVAKKFKVSKYVVLRRAFDLCKISSSNYWDTVLDWRKQDYIFYSKKKKRNGGLDYNVNEISHIGKRFVTLVMRAFQSEHLSSLDANRILGIDPIVVERNM